MSSLSAALSCHPRTPASAIERVQASVRTAAGKWTMTYLIAGDIARLRIPAARPPQHRDELWRHTCCELFVRPAAGEAYREFNFSPSGEWAAYQFQAYRQGMQPLPVANPPRIHAVATASSLVLDAELARDDLGDEGAVELALSAVIEEIDGPVSYWALEHRKDKPDFHHRAGFTLRVSA